MSADAAALDRDVPREVPDVRVLPAVALRAPDRVERVPAELAFPDFEVALALAPFFDREADADVRDRADVPDRADEDPPTHGMRTCACQCSLSKPCRQTSRQ